jgi:small GTP-binding protein
MSTFSAHAQARRPPTMKVLLLGDSGVGKSSLMMRFAANSFSEETNPTIGIDFRVKQLDLGEGEGGLVNLQLWDTAGQERFRTLTSSYYRGAHAMIFVFDITRPETLDSVKMWMQEAQSYCGAANINDIVMVLVANKVDYYFSQRGAATASQADVATTQSGTEDGSSVATSSALIVDPSLLTHDADEALRRKADEFARDHNMVYARCSAKTKEGVTHVFENIARSVVVKPSFSGGLYQQERENAVKLRSGTDKPRVDGAAAGGPCAC